MNRLMLQTLPINSVCAVHPQSRYKKRFSFCRPLETTTKVADVLKLIEDFFEKEKLDWIWLSEISQAEEF